ncbi:MAG: lipooligosaccharide transport system permease protein [Actinomycetota bacterium]
MTSSVVGVGRLVERELRTMRRLWHGIVFSAFVSPLLFLVAMGVGVGGYVDARSNAALGGLTYLKFVAPGLLAANIVQLAVGDSLWWVMGGTKWDKRYFAMIASPLGTKDVLAGHLAWQALRATFTTVAFLIVALLLGGLGSWWALVSPFAAVLLVVAVSAPVSAWSTWAESDRSFPVIMRVGVLPLFLFSGTFFPTANLPGWARPLVPLSPLYHGVELVRAATTGRNPGAGALLVHVGVLIGLFIAGWLVARRTFARRLSP